MNPYPGPRSVLVLDNCRIHHTDEIRELIEEEARKSFVHFTFRYELTWLQKAAWCFFHHTPQIIIPLRRLFQPSRHSFDVTLQITHLLLSTRHATTSLLTKHEGIFIHQDTLYSRVWVFYFSD